jgi:L-lactate dehydrogenase complex protein LldG
MSVEARAAILTRIGNANARAGDLSDAQAAWTAIPRLYSQSSSLSRDETIDLLTHRLLDYGAHLIRCHTADVPAKVREVLSKHETTQLIAPAGFPTPFLPEDFDVTIDSGLSGVDLDRFDAAITQCSVAIAETGTLALTGIAGQGRRAMSLVPDLHVCLLREQDVVPTVPEGWARLAPSGSLPITLISGPSATSDIEMTRIQGVHGPRTLYVILLTEHA